MNEKWKLLEKKLKCPNAILTKLRESTGLFSTDLFGLSQWFAKNSYSLYHKNL